VNEEAARRGRGICEESTMKCIILGLVIALTLMVSPSWAANWVLVHTWNHTSLKDFMGNPQANVVKVEDYIDADNIVLDEPKGLIYVWLRTKGINGDHIDYFCFRTST